MNPNTNGLMPYTEMAELLEHLPLLIRERRRAKRLSLRAAAEELGTNPNTLMRIESGEQITCSLELLKGVLYWLGDC